jgi:hypothetical protein
MTENTKGIAPYAGSGTAEPKVPVDVSEVNSSVAGR